MKTKFFLLASILFFDLMLSSAQEQCKVLMPEISGKYEGKCKNGLAHGKGTAEGKDKYSGYFKKGLPDGSGTYTWSSGEIYKGKFKAGKKEGEGKFFYKIQGVDSVRIGIWKDDVYFKKMLEKPYKVLRSTSVSRYSIHKSGDGSKVLFTVMQNGSPTSSYSNFQFTTTSGVPYSGGEKQGYEYIEFPFTCKVSYTLPNSMRTASIYVKFEVIIYEPGSWDITLNN